MLKSHKLIRLEENDSIITIVEYEGYYIINTHNKKQENFTSVKIPQKEAKELAEFLLKGDE